MFVRIKSSSQISVNCIHKFLLLACFNVCDKYFGSCIAVPSIAILIEAGELRVLFDGYSASYCKLQNLSPFLGRSLKECINHPLACVDVLML